MAQRKPGGREVSIVIGCGLIAFAIYLGLSEIASAIREYHKSKQEAADEAEKEG